MSKDAIAYTIRKSTFKEKELVDENNLNYSEYLYETTEKAPNYLKNIGTIVKIRYHLRDDQKACQDYYNSRYDCAQWYKTGLRFFYKNNELGFLSNEELKKYDYDEDKICYIAKIDKICSLDNCYALSFDSGVYTFDEILDECIRIADNDEMESEQDMVYGLVKTLKFSRDGEKIYIFVD